MVNGSIPEGQAAVMQLLEDCYEITYELQSETDAQETKGTEDEGIQV